MNHETEQQPPAYPLDILRVRTFGGKQPDWAAKLALKRDPVVEILIVRELPGAGVIDSDSPGAFPNPKTPTRILVVDETLTENVISCRNAQWIVSAPARDLDMIAEAFGRLVCGPVAIGVALADAYEVAGERALTPHFGKGAVVEGIEGDVVRRGLDNALRAFAEAGFDGGVFIIQSISKADDKQFDLQKLDEMFTLLLGEERERPVLLTTYCDASASAVMAISFKKAILK
jgi:hypothetical protein